MIMENCTAFQITGSDYRKKRKQTRLVRLDRDACTEERRVSSGNHWGVGITVSR